MICPFFFFFASHHILGFFFFVHQRKNLQTKYEEGIFAQRSWTLHKLAIILTKEVDLLLKSAAFQTIILIATVFRILEKTAVICFFWQDWILGEFWLLSCLMTNINFSCPPKQLTTEFTSCYQILHNAMLYCAGKGLF